MNMSTKAYDKEAAHGWDMVLKKLDELRSSGKTLEEIGRGLGVAKATTSRWLSRAQGGERNSFGEMVRYAKKLGISSQEMFGEIPEKMNSFDKKIAQELSENITHSETTPVQISINTGISNGRLESILSGTIKPDLYEFHAICKEISINPTILLNKAAAELESENNADTQQTRKSA
ncbi:helix-turn-helix transcriptional regulator [Maridesulfovibrio ferrireducens]|uniref:helix-turn-helix domain-containing protein n=1 Tax=Maridesulfovibrio ferrireducens TaxID=246191 RepID=UPI001A25DDBD|nr:helix-turn-helix transcriptional regulator [Maridesulfovibrio ferrireducens]MBI9113262.1 helix-turn-helix transcriptional regulator [Maridesulfovibrio ferrireducens]